MCLQLCICVYVFAIVYQEQAVASAAEQCRLQHTGRFFQNSPIFSQKRSKFLQKGSIFMWNHPRHWLSPATARHSCSKVSLLRNVLCKVTNTYIKPIFENFCHALLPTTYIFFFGFFQRSHIFSQKSPVFLYKSPINISPTANAVCISGRISQKSASSQKCSCKRLQK